MRGLQGVSVEAVAASCFAALLIVALFWLVQTAPPSTRPDPSRQSPLLASLPHSLSRSSSDESEAALTALSETYSRRRPSLRRARAVGVELAVNRGGVLKDVMRLHVEQRHGNIIPATRASPSPIRTDARSTFMCTHDRAALLNWVCGTLSHPDRIAGDAGDVRRVAFYRDWGCPVGVIGATAAETSVVKVVTHISVVAGAGSRPRLVTAYPCRAGASAKDVGLDDV